MVQRLGTAMSVLLLALTTVPPALAFDVDAVSRQIAAARTELEANPNSFDASVRLGFGYLAMDALEQAEAAFQTASLNHPSQLSGHYWLGRTLYARGRYDAAIASFMRVANRLPRWGEVYAEIGRCHFKLHRATEAETAFRTALTHMASAAGHPAEIVTPPLFGDDDHAWFEKVAPLNPVDVRYFLGLNALEQGRFAEAARECERALSVTRGAEILVLAGIIASRQGRLADAESAFLEASRIKPIYAPAFYQLGSVYSKTNRRAEAERAFARWKELDDAEKRFREEEAALLRNPDKAPSLVKIGSLHLNTGAIHDAIAAYRKAIWFDPNAVDAYNGLGHAYALLKDFGAALTAQHKALELDPNRAEVHAGLGFVRMQQALASHQESDFGAALTSYREAVRLKPSFIEAWSRIGEINAKLSRYTDAQSAYETVLSLLAKSDADANARRLSAQANQSLGDALLLQGKYDEAKTRYEQAAREDDTLVECRYNLGFLEYRAGNLDKAEAHYRSVVALDPDMPEAHHLLGLIYVDAERFADAEREYREALKLRADSVPTLERLAHLLGQEEGRLDEALELAKRATELHPQSDSYWNTLSWIRYRRGEYAEAEQAIRQALELDPRNALYQEGLRVLEGLRAKNPPNAVLEPVR